MAKVTIGSKFEIDLRGWDLSSLFQALPVAATKNHYALVGEGDRIDFYGKDFHYDRFGIPDGGTLKSMVLQADGQLFAEFTGLKVSVEALVAAAITGNKKDDRQLLADMLGGDDLIVGGAYDDQISAYGGDDRLVGRGGADDLKGGNGDDQFVFRSAKDSTKTNSDTILDFNAKDDVIDLSAIDANGSGRGDAAFDYLGSHRFTGAGAELRASREGRETVLLGDLDGDKVADLRIVINGNLTLHDNDFVL